MDPELYCEQRTAQSGSSLYYSVLFLPQSQRRAAIALHAFRRELYEIADECTDAGIARTKLAWWRLQVAAIRDGQPQHPVAQEMVKAVRAFDLPQEDFRTIIDGLDADLTQRRHMNFASLECNRLRVAGLFGQLCARVFGYTAPATLRHAELLGAGLQLTDMIRDVGIDARRDRVYLPLDEIARYRVTVADIMRARATENFRQLMEFQIVRALGYYRDAIRLLPAQDRKSQRPGLMLAALHEVVLNEIRADGSNVLNQRIRLTPLRKLWIASRTWYWK